MHRDQKLKVLMDGQKQGVSAACHKHQISRTLYYRWLKRYKTHGILGLDPVTKQFTPSNKTAATIANSLIALVKKHPLEGPKRLKYILEELGYDISESAVYNILRHNKLSTRTQRLQFAKKKESQTPKTLPALCDMASGESWIFWTTLIGTFDNVGPLYLYTFFDTKSKIACSRLYTNLSLQHFENLLTAVAMPVSQTLRLDAKALFIPKEEGLAGKNSDLFLGKIDKIVHTVGFDADLYHTASAEDDAAMLRLRNDYNALCVDALLTWLHQGLSLNEIQLNFQKHIRHYNLYHEIDYSDGGMTEKCSPIQYHSRSQHTELILPLWAYIERHY